MIYSLLQIGVSELSQCVDDKGPILRVKVVEERYFGYIRMSSSQEEVEYRHW